VISIVRFALLSPLLQTPALHRDNYHRPCLQDINLTFTMATRVVRIPGSASLTYIHVTNINLVAIVPNVPSVYHILLMPKVSEDR
jgi:hypothetical protein